MSLYLMMKTRHETELKTIFFDKNDVFFIVLFDKNDYIFIIFIDQDNKNDEIWFSGLILSKISP